MPEDLDPTDPFDRVIGASSEAMRREKAVRPLYQYERGLLTVGELADRLRKIADEPVFEEG